VPLAGSEWARDMEFMFLLIGKDPVAMPRPPGRTGRLSCVWAAGRMLIFALDGTLVFDFGCEAGPVPTEDLWLCAAFAFISGVP